MLRKNDAELSSTERLDKRVMEGQISILFCKAVCEEGNEKSRTCRLITTSRASFRKIAEDIRKMVSHE